jgi:hypothetical protein
MMLGLVTYASIIWKWRNYYAYSAVGLDTATSQKVVDSIPIGVTEIFHCFNDKIL